MIICIECSIFWSVIPSINFCKAHTAYKIKCKHLRRAYKTFFFTKGALLPSVISILKLLSSCLLPSYINSPRQTWNMFYYTSWPLNYFWEFLILHPFLSLSEFTSNAVIFCESSMVHYPSAQLLSLFIIFPSKHQVLTSNFAFTTLSCKITVLFCLHK